MTRLHRGSIFVVLIALVTIEINYQSVAAQTVVIPFTDSGWYNQDGVHTPSNPNYLVGEFYDTYRNFFVFNLASVTQPIASAKLALSVPSQLEGAGYYSSDPSEDYELYDVTTPITTLVGFGGVAAYNDLGSGVVYGSRTMTSADIGTVVEITLNASAIAALDAATGLIALGGSITTLDDFPGNYEFAFGISANPTNIRELRLTLVPEPSTPLLLGIGAISLVGSRKRRAP